MKTGQTPSTQTLGYASTGCVVWHDLVTILFTFSFPNAFRGHTPILEGMKRSFGWHSKSPEKSLF
jgi:hypothetical protein